jgi:hypothetical protein
MYMAGTGDYCDVFLTHDSMSGAFLSRLPPLFIAYSFDIDRLLADLLDSLVRKAHNSGRNHLSNVRDYYACESLSLPCTPLNVLASWYITCLVHKI